MADAARDLRRAWKKLIWTYCRKPGSFNFPRFALTNMKQDVVSRCLESEFGTDELARFWKDTSPHTKRSLAAFLELPQPPMLALYFGAADNRTPKATAWALAMSRLPRRLEPWHLGVEQFCNPWYHSPVRREARARPVGARRTAAGGVCADAHEGPATRLETAFVGHDRAGAAGRC